MIIDKSKHDSRVKRDPFADYDVEDASQSVLRDGKRLRVSMMMMDSDPTGLAPFQKQALCDAINSGVPFDRALETARSTTAPNDIRLHQPGFHGDAAPQAVSDAVEAYEKRNARLENAWRQPETVNTNTPVIPEPVQQQTLFAPTDMNVEKALESRATRLQNAWKA